MGCFWCSEAVFDRLKGVEKVASGYSGGHVKNPTYEQVSTGQTGHAESVQITFDPAQISSRNCWKFFLKRTTRQRSIARETTWARNTAR